MRRQERKAWGIGFSPSPEQSFEAAKKEWLAKAVTIYSDAKWETAKKPDMMCVTRGSTANARPQACLAGLPPPPHRQNRTDAPRPRLTQL